MDLYSPTLGLALAALAVAVSAAAVARFGLGGTKAAAGSRAVRLARVTALASLLLVAFSCLFHLFTGHRPGTPQAMGATEFLLQHPSLVVVAVFALLVLRWPGGPEPGRLR